MDTVPKHRFKERGFTITVAQLPLNVEVILPQHWYILKYPVQGTRHLGGSPLQGWKTIFLGRYFLYWREFHLFKILNILPWKRLQKANMSHTLSLLHHEIHYLSLSKMVPRTPHHHRLALSYCSWVHDVPLETWHLEQETISWPTGTLLLGSEPQRVQHVSKSHGYKVRRTCDLLEVLSINDTGANSFCLWYILTLMYSYMFLVRVIEIFIYKAKKKKKR